MARIRLEHVEKRFPNGHTALRDLDLDVADGELLVLVGPSGCGKSTALRVVAGLEAPSRGHVLFDGRDVTGDEPRARDVAMVFQSYALYPHKSVRDNLGFGLRMRGAAKDDIARRAAEVARRLGIESVLDRRPAELSGGQRQRVALGRALARCGTASESSRAAPPGDPNVFLLDEPLSNLDARLRLETRAEIARPHRERGVTMIYVTHDQEEAMTLGDRVAVLRDGRAEQVADPLTVYREPATAFVADFVGMPPMNWFRVRLESGDGARILAGAELRLPAPPDLALAEGTELVLGVRPQDLELAVEGSGELSGRIDVVEMLGANVVIHARGGTAFRVVTSPEARPAVGDAVRVSLRRERIHLFDAGSGERLGGELRFPNRRLG